jgi:preprotein translocase subunit SecE
MINVNSEKTKLKPRHEVKTIGPKKSKLDVFLWSIVSLLLAGGVVANYYFSAYPISLRLIGWLFLVLICVGVAYQTATGKKTWQFLVEARSELRKVVWPTRQETVQTTLVVIGMVILMGLILWGIDSVLLWIVGKFTG